MIRDYNIVGKTFGTTYIVSELTPKKYTRRFLVRCGCGFERPLDYQYAIKQQGCKWCAHKKERPYRRKRPFEATYNIFKGRARYDVEITYEQFLKLTEIKDCHYCDSPITWKEYRTKNKGGNGSNLDRKNNNIGYTADNVVVCCGRCNYAKGSHFSYNEWKEIGKVIKTFSKREYKITPQSRKAVLEKILEEKGFDI